MKIIFDYNSFLSAIMGGILTIIATYITLNYENRKSRNEKEEEKKKCVARFFLELNYNKRKIIYTIKNKNYILTSLDSSNWKNFIYSDASHILSKDKELVDDLATLDSMIDQTNNLTRLISDSLKAKIFATGQSISGSGTTEKLQSTLRDYAKDHLRPQIEKVIPKLEELYKKL